MWQRLAVAAQGETPASAKIQRVENMLVPRGRRVFEGTVRILRVSSSSQRPWIDLTLLEFKIQIRLEYLILVERIDGYVASSPCAVGAVDTPGIRVGDVEEVLHQPACIRLSGQGLAD